MTQGKPRDPRKEQFWRDTLARWQDSGLSIRAFCRRHRLSEPSFYAWRRTLAQRPQPATPTAATPPLTFVPLHLRHDLPARHAPIVGAVRGGHGVTSADLSALFEFLSPRLTSAGASAAGWACLVISCAVADAWAHHRRRPGVRRTLTHSA